MRVDEQQQKSQRPLLIIKHNVKAGGGGRSIMKLIHALRPLKLDKDDGYTRWKQADPKRHHVAIKDFQNVSVEDSENGFIISSIREPCSQYLSLWAHRSRTAEQDQVTSTLAKEDNMNKEVAYGKDGPLYISNEDVHRFREKWLNSTDVRGLIARSFHKSFETSNQTFSSSMYEKPKQVDCWVYVEIFNHSFLSCLLQYERQGGYIDWKNKKMIELVQKVKQEENDLASNRRLVIGRDEEDNPLRNLHAHRRHHGSCRDYYKSNSKHMIEYGPEQFIYSMFGYGGCCNPGVMAHYDDLLGLNITDHIKSEPILKVGEAKNKDKHPFKGSFLIEDDDESILDDIEPILFFYGEENITNGTAIEHVSWEDQNLGQMSLSSFHLILVVGIIFTARWYQIRSYHILLQRANENIITICS